MPRSLTDDELQRVYAWVDEIPLSRPKRNINRDFSDGGMCALGECAQTEQGA